ncbi:uncharacterized protein LOC121991284 [Zingiber officinale]|uniref:uncharacterized protein LOC121991284 n=1 Tax=Zingiber officinale TaxID=94328 RepID=UPI001C4CDFF7|nr:uncharacterized protein LOC121991284 [Zingiber officinale]
MVQDPKPPSSLLRSRFDSSKVSGDDNLKRVIDFEIQCAVLDKNLQEAMHKYLEERGIESSLFDILHEYMLNTLDNLIIRDIGEIFQIYKT